MTREQLKNEFIRLCKLNIPKNPRCASQMDDVLSLAEILSDQQLETRINKMRQEYKGTRLEKHLGVEK